MSSLMHRGEHFGVWMKAELSTGASGGTHAQGLALSREPRAADTAPPFKCKQLPMVQESISQSPAQILKEETSPPSQISLQNLNLILIFISLMNSGVSHLPFSGPWGTFQGVCRRRPPPLCENKCTLKNVSRKGSLEQLMGRCRTC